MGGHNFNAAFAWLTLIIYFLVNLSALTSGAKSNILNLAYYLFITIWYFGMMIIYFLI